MTGWHIMSELDADDVAGLCVGNAMTCMWLYWDDNLLNRNIFMVTSKQNGCKIYIHYKRLLKRQHISTTSIYFIILYNTHRASLLFQIPGKADRHLQRMAAVTSVPDDLRPSVTPLTSARGCLNIKTNILIK